MTAEGDSLEPTAEDVVPRTAGEAADAADGGVAGETSTDVETGDSSEEGSSTDPTVGKAVEAEAAAVATPVIPAAAPAIAAAAPVRATPTDSLTGASSLRALRRIRWLVLGSFAILLPVAVLTSRSRIENDIDHSVRTVLDQAGYAKVFVDVNGQDVKLTGIVASQAEKDEAVRLAGLRNGVRVVDAVGVRIDAGAPAAAESAVAPTSPSDDATTAAAPAVRRPTHISGKIAGSTLTVTATVSNAETKRALLSKAIATLAPDALVDEVIVDPADGTSDPDAHEAMGDFLADLIVQRFDDVSFDYDNGSLLLNARVTDATRVDTLRSLALTLVTDPVKLQADISVESAPSATDLAGNTSTTVAASTTTVAMSAELVTSTQTTLVATINGRTIGFEPGSARLDDTGKQVVADLAAAIKAIPSSELRFLVAGYTDTSGSAAGNRRLSQRRASAVKAALVEAGVKSKRIDASGFGSADPIADNETEEGRIKNRRIEVSVITPDGITLPTTTAPTTSTSQTSAATTTTLP